MPTDDLGARFDLREEGFAHGEFAARIELPVSSEALIDDSAFNADERLPYWAELWPSARALARSLLDEPAVPGPAIELGCGVALPSLALLHRGTPTLATDYYADALLFAERNADRNGLGPLATREVDWRRPPAELGRFRLLVAADVLYEERNVEPLMAAIEALVEEGGEVWVADPGRLYFQPFLEAAGQRGWTVRAMEHREERADGPLPSTRVSIARLVRQRRDPKW